MVESIVSNLFIILIALDPTDPPGKPVVVDSDKNFIKIQWDKPKKDGGAPVLSYNVERKDPRTGVWTKINDDPIKVTFLIPRQTISVLLEYYRERFLHVIWRSQIEQLKCLNLSIITSVCSQAQLVENIVFQVKVS